MAKKKKKVEEAAGSDTVTMFLSLMILLLAFFIVLVSMSTIEEKKKEQALQSIYSTFGSLPGGTTPFTGGITSSDASAPINRLDSDFKAIKEIAYKEVGRDRVALKTDAGRRIISIEGEVLFDPESITLKPSIMPFLDGLAKILKGGKYFIRIGGHTDDVPPDPRGPARDNWALSAYRALAVLKVLARDGVAPDRMAAYGYGPINPLRPNNSPKNRAANHRVELVMDESLSGQVEGLRARQRPDRLRFKGFVFDLFGEAEDVKKSKQAAEGK